MRSPEGPWIKLFTQEDFAAYAYLTSQIELLYWRQGAQEDELTDLKEAGNKREWLKTVHSLVRIQSSELGVLRKKPNLQSNHLQALHNVNLDVAEYQLDRYQTYAKDPERFWEDWDTGSLDRMRNELAFDHATLARMANLVDYHDPDFRSAVLIYRLLDLFVLVLEQLSDDDITYEFISTFKEFARSDTIQEAQEKIDELIEFEDKDINEWNELYLDRINADFSALVLSDAAINRGEQQLADLTREVFHCLSDIYNDLKIFIKQIPKSLKIEDLEALELDNFNQTLEKVALGFGKYPDRQLDRAIFLASIVMPPQKPN